MLVIDTNVLVHAANVQSELHRPCRVLVESIRERTSPWYLTWGICYEFMRICTHPRVLARPWSAAASRDFLEKILDEPSAGLLLPTEMHLSILANIFSEIPRLSGNILHDVHTATLMREHGIKEIYTLDADFHRFPFLTVIDPTR